VFKSSFEEPEHSEPDSEEEGGGEEEEEGGGDSESSGWQRKREVGGPVSPGGLHHSLSKKKPFRVITPPCTCARAPLPPFFAHMASFVRIALAGAGSFAKMEIRAGDDISDLVERACVKFPHWGTADKLSLYLVAAGGKDEPTEEAISAVLSSGGRLGVGWSIEDAGISSGTWLVARKIADGGAFCLALRASPPVLPTHPLTYPPPHTHLQVHPSLAAAAGVAVAVAVATLLRSSAPL
jgi:hypothetical protein